MDVLIRVKTEADLQAVKSAGAEILEVKKKTEEGRREDERATVAKKQFIDQIRTLRSEIPLLGRAIDLVKNPFVILATVVAASVRELNGWMAALQSQSDKQAAVDAVDAVTDAHDRYRESVKKAAQDSQSRIESEIKNLDRLREKQVDLAELDINKAVREGRMSEMDAARAISQMRGGATEESELNALRMTGSKLFSKEMQLRSIPNIDPAFAQRNLIRQQALAAAETTDFGAIQKEINDLIVERDTVGKFGAIDFRRAAQFASEGLFTETEQRRRFDDMIEEKQNELEGAIASKATRDLELKRAQGVVDQVKVAEQLRDEIAKLRTEMGAADRGLRGERPANQAIRERRLEEDMNRVNEENLRRDQERGREGLERQRRFRSGFDSSAAETVPSMQENMERLAQALINVKSQVVALSREIKD